MKQITKLRVLGMLGLCLGLAQAWGFADEDQALAMEMETRDYFGEGKTVAQGRGLGSPLPGSFFSMPAESAAAAGSQTKAPSQTAAQTQPPSPRLEPGASPSSGLRGAAIAGMAILGGIIGTVTGLVAGAVTSAVAFGSVGAVLLGTIAYFTQRSHPFQSL